MYLFRFAAAALTGIHQQAHRERGNEADMYRCENCFKEYEEGYDICPHCGYVRNSGKREVYMLPIGVTLRNGRYIIGKILGNGGFGITYKAWDMTLNRCVAIKEFYPSGIVNRVPGTSKVMLYAVKRRKEYDAQKKRFWDEAVNTKSFNQDNSKRNHNIVDVLDYLEENDTAYFVMEFLDGVPLNKYLKERGGKLPVKEAADIVLKIANALITVHEKGFVHRDISPDNIFMCKDNVVKLIDFGAARFTRDEDSLLSIILKPGYAPPEQYETVNEQGPWTDIYALGATMYHLLTGEKPEESTNRKINDEVIPPHELDASISENLSNTIMRAMAIDKHLRFESAQEFIEAINICLDEGKSKKKKVLSPKEVKKRKKRIRNTTIGIALAIVLAGFTIFAFNFEKQREEETLPTATIDVWCMEYEDTIYGSIEDSFDSIINRFKESYDNVTINVTVFSQEEYIDRLSEAIETGEAPDLFLSSGLDSYYLTNAYSLTSLAKNYYKDNCIFYSEYCKAYPEYRQIPLGFTYPVVYVNTGLVEYDKDTARNMKAIIGDMEYENAVTNEGESFYLKEYPVFSGSTTDYFDVQSHLSGSYVMVVLESDGFPLEGRGDFCYEWSIMAQDKDEQKVAEKLLEYLMTAYSQDVLLVQGRQNMLPLNRSMLAAYVDSYGEYEALYKYVK